MLKHISFAVILLMMLSVCGLGQDTETLFSGEVEHGGFGGPVLKGTMLNGSPALLVGGRGGWIINHTLIVGGGGYGLVTSTDAKVASVYGEKRIEFGYGGLELEYVRDWDRLIHWSVSLLVGAGGIGYRHSDMTWTGFNPADEMDQVFVLEPAVEAHLNVTKFFTISAGGSYRYVTGVTTKATSNASMSGGSAVLSFRFGKF